MLQVMVFVVFLTSKKSLSPCHIVGSVIVTMVKEDLLIPTYDLQM